MQHGDDSAVLLITAFQIFYAFFFMFIGCELSQRVNVAFDECNDMVEQFDWYLLPSEIQRMLPFIMHFSQQPVEINCFGSWACDRATFKYVSTPIASVSFGQCVGVNYSLIFEFHFFSGDQNRIFKFHGPSEILLLNLKARNLYKCFHNRSAG